MNVLPMLFRKSFREPRVTWRNFNNTYSPTPYVLLRNNFTGSYDGHGFSNESIPSNTDGKLSYTSYNGGGDKAIGLSTADTGNSFANIGFAIAFNGNDGYGYIYLSGSYSGFRLTPPNNTGTIYTIERIGTIINFAVDGIIGYAATSGVPTGALFADASIYTNGIEFTDVKLEF